MVISSALGVHHLRDNLVVAHFGETGSSILAAPEHLFAGKKFRYQIPALAIFLQLRTWRIDAFRDVFVMIQVGATRWGLRGRNSLSQLASCVDDADPVSAVECMRDYGSIH